MPIYGKDFAFWNTRHVPEGMVLVPKEHLKNVMDYMVDGMSDDQKEELKELIEAAE